MICVGYLGRPCSAADFSRVAGATRESERERDVGALNLNAMAPRGDGGTAAAASAARRGSPQRSGGRGGGGIPLRCAAAAAATGYLCVCPSVVRPPSPSLHYSRVRDDGRAARATATRPPPAPRPPASRAERPSESKPRQSRDNSGPHARHARGERDQEHACSWLTPLYCVRFSLSFSQRGHCITLHVIPSLPSSLPTLNALLELESCSTVSCLDFFSAL